MNEFVEQFLIEARELVDQAADDLLALEQNPRDAERLGSAFRAFHTLKGAAGIVDFDAMAHALHAAEDVLSRVRSGERVMSPRLIADGLACLDQVARWLDIMQVSGEPPADAGPAAEALAARFAATAPRPTPSTGEQPAPAPLPADWVGSLLALHADVRPAARTALRYRPAADAFFRGDDPMAIIEAVPGLLALHLSPGEPWPPLAAFDPFHCQLVLQALSAAEAAPVAAAFGGLGAQVEVVPLPVGGLSAGGRAILEAQRLLVAEHDADSPKGRLASAARTAANVMRHAGDAAAAGRLESALEGGPPVLTKAIEAVLTGLPMDIDDVDGLAETTSDGEPAAPEAGSRGLRVDARRIDALVRLTGELTVVKNAFGHLSRLAQSGGDPRQLAARIKDQHARLGRLTDELQRAVLGLRLLPMRHVFRRFPRLVRDMGVDLGKPMRLAVDGDDTEADKAVVEALFEPLLHVMRNAADHGVEAPSARAAAGKPATATIWLRASRQGDRVRVSVDDDGRGIDIERVRRIAGERGLAAAETLAELDAAGVADLVFAPGFSTTETVTGLSGRGVGMDAVRSAIERLGGRVWLETGAGTGTRVIMTLPFTVMMTPVITVEAGGQTFGIPLDAVVETVRLPRESIHAVGAAEAFVLRDRTAPLINLAQALGVGVDEDGPRAAQATIVVAAFGGQLSGLEVGRVGERMDVLLKPMDGLLSGMHGVAGTTLMGDGRVLLVLDLADLLQ